VVDETLIMDMEHHYIPPEALRLIRKTSEHDYTASAKRFSVAFESAANIDKHLKWMDDSGIDMAILSTPQFSANGHDFCKVCNDGYSKVIKRYPDRFKGMIHVYPHEKEKVKDEIKRGVEELGLWGIGTVSSYQETTIDSAEMDTLYEMAMNYDMPIYVHPSSRKNLWGGECYDLYMILSREYDLAKSFVEMVYGVFPRFPGLNVIFSHLGGGLPTLKGRLLAWHQPKDYPLPQEDRGQGLPIHQAQELGLVDDFESRIKTVFFNSAGFGGWLPVMKSAFETLGSDHLCFGTDYPYEIREASYMRRIIRDIMNLGIPGEDKERFFSRNLKGLFLIK